MDFPRGQYRHLRWQWKSRWMDLWRHGCQGSSVPLPLMQSQLTEVFAGEAVNASRLLRTRIDLLKPDTSQRIWASQEQHKRTHDAHSRLQDILSGTKVYVCQELWLGCTMDPWHYPGCKGFYLLHGWVGWWPDPLPTCTPLVSLHSLGRSTYLPRWMTVTADQDLCWWSRQCKLPDRIGMTISHWLKGGGDVVTG